MAVKSVQVDEKKKELTIVMELQKPSPSKSGKTHIVATTGGNQATEAEVDGKVITLGVNAYIRP